LVIEIVEKSGSVIGGATPIPVHYGLLQHVSRIAARRQALHRGDFRARFAHVSRVSPRTIRTFRPRYAHVSRRFHGVNLRPILAALRPVPVGATPHSPSRNRGSHTLRSTRPHTITRRTMNLLCGSMPLPRARQQFGRGASPARMHQRATGSENRAHIHTRRFQHKGQAADDEISTDGPAMTPVPSVVLSPASPQSCVSAGAARP
jgi:hypothetical protein